MNTFEKRHLWEKELCQSKANATGAKRRNVASDLLQISSVLNC